VAATPRHAVWSHALASRVQRSLPFLLCGALGLTCAAIIRSVTDAPEILWAASGIGGLALGAFLAINMALAMRLMPVERAGTYLGALNIADTIPQVWGPIVAASLLALGTGDPISGAHDNYFALYLAAAAVAALSLASLPAIRAALREAAAHKSPAAAQSTAGTKPAE
jgi:MFS family permease